MRFLFACVLAGCGTTAAVASTSSAPDASTPPATDASTMPAPVVDASVAPSPCAGKDATTGDATWTLPSGRTANVHIPNGYDPSRPTPIVLDFHGWPSDPTQEAELTGMAAKADAAGFVAIFPVGTDESWNAGSCCGSASDDNVDDVGFVRDLVDFAATKLCLDEKRVFATGMSNGGELVQRLACELADRVAAVASVAAVIEVTSCAPSRPISVLSFHGTADLLEPYDGDPSATATFDGWATRDMCTDASSVTYQNGDVTCRSHVACAAGTEVTLCTIQDGGHTWPGGLEVPLLGETTKDISATDAMWAFFEAHPRP